MNKALIDALDDCLQRIQAGDSLEKVLSSYPQWAGELRPLLAAALDLQALQHELTVPASAQAASRARLLAKAQAASQARLNWFQPVFYRRGPVLAASLALVIILILGTGIASAAAIPGDMLYPVKLARERTQLLFVTDPVRRLELEQTFDQERADETEALIEHRRESEVTFSGTLIRTAGGQWMVSKIDVVFPALLEPEAVALQNSYVEAHGVLQSNGALLVESINLRQIEFSGVLQGINDGQWTISRVPVVVDPGTTIIGTTKLGDNVQVKAIRREDGALVAREIDGQGFSKDETPQASPTKTPGEIEDSTQTPLVNPTSAHREDPTQSEQEVTPSPESTQKPEQKEPTEVKPTETKATDAKPTEVKPTEADDSGHASSEYRSPTPTPGGSNTMQPTEHAPSDDSPRQTTPTPGHESEPTATPQHGDH